MHAKEFKQRVNDNPAWALTLTDRINISTYCDMVDSPITHLSPYLHFMATNSEGNCASFNNCRNLQTATGNFAGWVTFARSGVTKIKRLRITRPNKYGEAASFASCPNLKVATGNFPGSVVFNHSGIEKIENLTLHDPLELHAISHFHGCEKLLPKHIPKECLTNPKITFDPQTLARIQAAQLRHAILHQPEMEI